MQSFDKLKMREYGKSKLPFVSLLYIAIKPWYKSVSNCCFSDKYFNEHDWNFYYYEASKQIFSELYESLCFDFCIGTTTLNS